MEDMFISMAHSLTTIERDQSVKMMSLCKNDDMLQF